MGSVVAAVGMSHILAGKGTAEAQAERVFAGFQELGKSVADTDADLILFIVCDHMANFGTSLEAPFTVGVAESYLSLGDMDLPLTDVSGEGDFGRALVAGSSQRGFDLAVAHEIRPDHGLMIPRLFVDPEAKRPIVPLNININMNPPPSPKRCWELGRAIGAFISTEACTKRVLIVATGGLSHWIMRPEMGRVNADFDRACMDAIAAGNGADLSEMTFQQLEENAGNGGAELVTWLCMAGAVAPHGGRVVFYEPMETWLTGMGAIVMKTGTEK